MKNIAKIKTLKRCPWKGYRFLNRMELIKSGDRVRALWEPRVLASYTPTHCVGDRVESRSLQYIRKIK